MEFSNNKTEVTFQIKNKYTVTKNEKSMNETITTLNMGALSLWY